MSVTMELVRNDFNTVADQLESGVSGVVAKTVFDIHGLAIETSPWDTRYMISTHKPELAEDGQSGEVAVYADYSLFVHEGHRTVNAGYVPGRPWLADAAEYYRPIFNTAIMFLLRPR